MNLYKALLIPIVVTAIASCGSTSVSVVPENSTENPENSDSTDTVDSAPARSLIVVESGGCVRTGPNCAIYTLYTNGRYELSRHRNFSVTSALEADTREIETTGQLDAGTLNSWLEFTENEDFSVLRDRLAEGACAGCFDGIDYLYSVILSGTDTETEIAFSSIEYDLDSGEPAIAMMTGIYTAMSTALSVEIRRE